MSTLGIDDVAPLADLAQANGALFVDAPVQGARPVPEKGELLIYAAGPQTAQPILRRSSTFWAGAPTGSTTRTARPPRPRSSSS
jgi:3-hydroxyisobutyrate dehydrogenase